MSVKKIVLQLIAVILVLFSLDTQDHGLCRALNVMAVSIHELGHAAAAILSGGDVMQISVLSNEGGQCITNQGFQFLIISMGYTSSMLAGALLLRASQTGSSTVMVNAALGSIIFIGALTLPFENNYSRMSAIALSAVLGSIIILELLLPALGVFLERAVGTYWCAYSVMDLIGDTLSVSTKNDITELAKLTRTHTTVIMVLWTALLLTIGFFSIRTSLLHSASARPKFLQAKHRA